MKKRTARLGYGKYHQHAAAAGTAAMKAGNRAMAAVEYAKLTKPNPIGGFRKPANVRGH